MSWTLVHIFFPACHMLMIWLELWREELYRNDLKGNKTNYFELTGGSS